MVVDPFPSTPSPRSKVEHGSNIRKMRNKSNVEHRPISASSKFAASIDSKCLTNLHDQVVSFYVSSYVALKRDQ